MLLRLDMQSDGSPHFLTVSQERPMYHSTSSPRASRSPCEELSGPRRGTSEIGSSASKRNPMADWQMREKRPPRGPRPEPAGPTDRKSTRLNSSHITISYAVFCLKKKRW